MTKNTYGQGPGVTPEHFTVREEVAGAIERIGHAAARASGGGAVIRDDNERETTITAGNRSLQLKMIDVPYPPKHPDRYMVGVDMTSTRSTEIAGVRMPFGRAASSERLPLFPRPELPVEQMVWGYEVMLMGRIESKMQLPPGKIFQAYEAIREEQALKSASGTRAETATTAAPISSGINAAPAG